MFSHQWARQAPLKQKAAECMNTLFIYKINKFGPLTHITTKKKRTVLK